MPRSINAGDTNMNLHIKFLIMLTIVGLIGELYFQGLLSLHCVEMLWHLLCFGLFGESYIYSLLWLLCKEMLWYCVLGPSHSYKSQVWQLSAVTMNTPQLLMYQQRSAALRSGAFLSKSQSFHCIC